MELGCKQEADTLMMGHSSYKELSAGRIGKASEAFNQLNNIWNLEEQRYTPSHLAGKHYLKSFYVIVAHIGYSIH